MKLSTKIVSRGRKRYKHARELLAEHENDWGGNSDLDELAASKYAVVWMSGEQSWVLRAEDARDLAGHYLDAAGGSDSGDTEWIDSVIDLDTGTAVSLTHRVIVTLTMPDGTREIAGETDGLVDTDYIREALEGDSNDAEHDALVSVADDLGIEYTLPDLY